MYFLLGSAFISAAFFWYSEISSLCTLSVIAAIIFATWINIRNLQRDVFLAQSIYCMDKTECCFVHAVWSDPKSVIWTTGVFRILAAISAMISLYLTWEYQSSFADKHYFLVTGIWILTCIIWLVSILPFFICLVQCAARQTKKKLKPLRIASKILGYQQELVTDRKKVKLVSSEELIIRFRTVVFMWSLHDIVLGVFWFYLSFELYDLTDDEDDSGWRTIFLSMISWHIIFIVLHHMYLKDLWSCVKITKISIGDTPCCAPSEANKWWAICQLIGLGCIYVSVIQRMNTDELTKMGCSEETLVLFCTGVALLYFGKTMISKTLYGSIDSTEYGSIPTTKNKHDVLDRLQILF